MIDAWFFVYGTLKRGQCREACWPAAPLQVQTGFVRGTLVDLVDYPALLPGDNWVRGEVWLIASQHVAETLRVLDAIEGFQPGRANNLYDRRSVAVYRSTGDAQPMVTAHTYWYADATVNAAVIAPREHRQSAEWPPGKSS